MIKLWLLYILLVTIVVIESIVIATSAIYADGNVDINVTVMGNVVAWKMKQLRFS